MEGSRKSLDIIQVQSPCSESWDQMSGSEQTRFCAGCQRHVHNLSQMTRDEAERLICDAAGRLCVRFERMADGNVRTLDYQPTAKRARTWRFWSLLGLCGGAAAFVVRFVMQTQPVPATTGQMVLGDVMTPLSPATSPQPPAACEVKE